MSIFAMAWAKRQRTGSPTRKLVLLTLADYADDNGVAWPSQITLARETELHERTIRRALQDLEKINFIDRKSRPPLSSGQLQTDLVVLKMAATGQSDRRQLPSDFDDANADTESGKQSRNYSLSGRELRVDSKRGSACPKTPRGQTVNDPDLGVLP